MNEKIIMHVDVNSAFLSWSACHKVNILGESLDLRTIPSIVGGDQSTRHGIVLAKSIPAKKYNIQTGEPVAAALKKCPNLVIAPPDYNLYVKSSLALMDILNEVAPVTSQYSIDEAYCEFSGTKKVYGPPVLFAETLKDRIYKELGFTVNIGISCNKLLAKMASELKKPNRVHTLFPSEIPEKMWRLPVSELFFVGHRTAAKLYQLGIFTIGQLAGMDINLLHSHFKKHGEVIYNFANGIDFSELEPIAPPNKGYGNSMTVPFDVRDIGSGHHVILALCETVGMRLRKDNVKISVVTISLTDYEFNHRSHQMQLPTPTNVTYEIYQAACRLFNEAWDQQTPIRQIGVHTTKVSTDSCRQYNIFDGVRYDRLEQLDQAVDLVRKRYGENSLIRACFLNSKINHMSGGIDKEKRSGITKPIISQ